MSTKSNRQRRRKAVKALTKALGRPPTAKEVKEYLKNQLARRKAVKALTKTLGRPPTSKEVKEYLKNQLAGRIDNDFAQRERNTGRLELCLKLIRQYLPGTEPPASWTKARRVVERIRINIWSHRSGTATLLTVAEMEDVKRTNPFPLDAAKQSEVLRLLLR